MKIKGKYFFAGVLIIFCIALAYDSLSNYINPYLSVTQVVRNIDGYNEKSIQVMGVVERGSVLRGNEGPVRFTLTDGYEAIAVQYSGALPQNFDEGRDVVVVGSLKGGDALEASKILVKCPSKYEGEEPPRQNNHIFLTAMAVALMALAYLAVTMLWRRS